MSIHRNRIEYLRRLRRISEARARRCLGHRKFIREDVETDTPETDEVTITLSKEDIEILKSILAKAGACEDCEGDEDYEAPESEEEPESDEVEIVDVDMEPTPESDDSAYYA